MHEVDHGDEVGGGAEAMCTSLGGLDEGGAALEETVGNSGAKPAQDPVPLCLDVLRGALGPPTSHDQPEVWRTHWARLTPVFDYPPQIRKVIYTTNAIEALNTQLRKVTKERGSFPNPEAVRKAVYVAIMKASERCTRPVQDWPTALNHRALVFPGRVPA